MDVGHNRAVLFTIILRPYRETWNGKLKLYLFHLPACIAARSYCHSSKSSIRIIINTGSALSEVVAVVELFLDGEQPRGVPRVEAGDLVVLLHLLCEPVHVLFLALLDQGLQPFGGGVCLQVCNINVVHSVYGVNGHFGRFDLEDRASYKR